MAVHALSRRHSVRTGQLKTGCGVIENRIRPENGVVAGLARCREPNRDVINGSDRVVVVRLMTGNACRIRQVVVVIDVAIGTLPRRNDMTSRECEPCTAVIEGRIEP